jgi:hypothetical protein
MRRRLDRRRLHSGDAARVLVGAGGKQKRHAGDVGVPGADLPAVEPGCVSLLGPALAIRSAMDRGSSGAKRVSRDSEVHAASMRSIVWTAPLACAHVAAASPPSRTMALVSSRSMLPRRSCQTSMALAALSNGLAQALAIASAWARMVSRRCA